MQQTKIKKNLVVQITPKKKKNYFFSNLKISLSYDSFFLPKESRIFLVFSLILMVVNPFSDGIFLLKTYNPYSLYNLYINLSGKPYKPIGSIFPIDYLRVVALRGGRREKMPIKNVIIDIETLSLDPLDPNARIVAIGVKCGNYNEVLISTKEEKLLEKFWGLPFFEGYFRLIGFNSFCFDIPYLLVRSFKYGIRIPDIRGKSIDLRFVLSYGNKFKNGKLTDYTKLFLGENGNKNGCSGENVENLWKSGRFDELKAYCEHDVFLTNKIFERLTEMGVING